MVFGWPWKDVRVLIELDGERSTFGRQKKSLVIQLGDAIVGDLVQRTSLAFERCLGMSPLGV